MNKDRPIHRNGANHFKLSGKSTYPLMDGPQSMLCNKMCGINPIFYIIGCVRSTVLKRNYNFEEEKNQR